MSLELLPEAKKIVSELLIANVSELFFELMDNDRYKDIVALELTLAR